MKITWWIFSLSALWIHKQRTNFCEGKPKGEYPSSSNEDQCPELPTLPNGHFEKPCMHSGRTCRFSCHKGYRLKGSATWTCRDNGTWSGAETQCNAVICGPLIPPTNVTISPSSCLRSSTYNQTCTFSCQTSGYVLNGFSSRVCSDDGSWTGSNNTRCRPIEPTTTTVSPSTTTSGPDLNTATEPPTTTASPSITTSGPEETTAIEPTTTTASPSTTTSGPDLNTAIEPTTTTASPSTTTSGPDLTTEPPTTTASPSKTTSGPVSITEPPTTTASPSTTTSGPVSITAIEPTTTTASPSTTTSDPDLNTAITVRRRGDPRGHQAYGRATSLTIINQVKKKCCKCPAWPTQ